MKKFTLLTVLFTLLSVTAFAQKPQLHRQLVPAKKVLKANRSGETKAYTYGFSQALNGWTTIDADGDGHAWVVTIDKSFSGHDGKPGVVQSASYIKDVGPVTPDNYLVSPKMKLDGKITFYACAQDASYPAEHFAVAVSTTSGTDASAFTTVQEWTMTAARQQAPANSRRVQGAWYQYEIDLSSYAGAEGYVAIRHFNCSDFFYLNVDDITLETSELLDPYVEALEQEAEPEPGPELVTLPDGVVAEEYSMSYTYLDDDKNELSGTKPIKVAVDGNDVYFQGMSYYFPNAWVKGVKDGNSVTFAAMQYVGEDSYGASYFFYGTAPVVFTYDADANSYSATGEVFGVQGEQYYDGYYINPVLTKVADVAATPATPTISAIAETTYGDILDFSVPTVDINGNGLSTDKLSFQFFVDVEKEVTPLTFTTEDFSQLEADMTVIPYGFTDKYDFYPDFLYLNMAHDTWNKIGIQSIYTGGGEERKSEIFWYTIKAYSSVSFDFNAMDLVTSSGNSTAGDITEDQAMTAGDVTLTISAKAAGDTENRFWGTSKGPQLRVYSGTLTFEVPATRVITKLTFNCDKWNADNAADCGEFDKKVWTGSSNKVVVTIAGNSQINSIDVETAEFVPTPIEAPEGLVTETYNFTATALENGKTETVDYSLQVQVGFDGDDVYIQGLADSYPEGWIKATKNADGKYVIPASQYIGTFVIDLSIGTYEFPYYLTAMDENKDFADVVLTFDAETNTFSTAQTVVLNGAMTEWEPYITFNDVVITKMNEVAATPANPSVDTEKVKLTGTSYPYVSFIIPAVGTEGEELLTNKLFYTIWIKKGNEVNKLTFTKELYPELDADTDEIPYAHNGYDIYAAGERIYLNQGAEEIASWTSIGIQSIYYGGGECNKSEIGWYEIPTDGISATLNDKGQMTNHHVYDLQGRKVANPKKGLYIVNGKLVVVK